MPLRTGDVDRARPLLPVAAVVAARCSDDPLEAWGRGKSTGFRTRSAPTRCYVRAHDRRRSNPWLVLVLVCLAQFMVDPRRDDRERRAAVDPERPRDVGRRTCSGSSTRTRSCSAASCCSAGAPATCRAQAGLPRRRRPLHRRLAPLRRSHRATTWLIIIARPAGPRRGARLARRARRSSRRRSGKAPSGRRRSASGPRSRSAAAPSASCSAAILVDAALLAVDLLRQRPGRDRRLRPLAALRARVEGRARAPELRRRRRGRPSPAA